ncbi:MAG TPA: hypothetical protein VE616_23270 [Candidatus Udaeobacter sp.]|nr:hypothetical protein [Candidatus Udaeobacter sp.]
MLKKIIGVAVFRRDLAISGVGVPGHKHLIVDINACPKDGPLRPEHIIVKPKFLQQVSREHILQEGGALLVLPLECLRVVAD